MRIVVGLRRFDTTDITCENFDAIGIFWRWCWMRSDGVELHTNTQLYYAQNFLFCFFFKLKNISYSIVGNVKIS